MFGKRSASAGAAPAPALVPQGQRSASAPATSGASARPAPVLVVSENRRPDSYYVTKTTVFSALIEAICSLASCSEPFAMFSTFRAFLKASDSFASEIR